MRILIIEDEAPAYRRLQSLITRYQEGGEVLEVLDSVSEAVKWIRNHRMPDLIYSDIQLSDGLSFEIYRQVEVTCPIVFTTAYDGYMLEAFKTNGIDYLLKPLNEEDFVRCLEKLRRITHTSQPDITGLLAALQAPRQVYKSRFLIKLGSKLIPVQVNDVAWFCSTEGTTAMCLTNGKTLICDEPLDELERVLDPGDFFRLNRQFIARAGAIDAVHQYFKGKLKIALSPLPEGEVIVSREKARAFRNWLGDESAE